LPGRLQVLHVMKRRHAGPVKLIGLFGPAHFSGHDTDTLLWTGSPALIPSCSRLQVQAGSLDHAIVLREWEPTPGSSQALHAAPLR